MLYRFALLSCVLSIACSSKQNGGVTNEGDVVPGDSHIAANKEEKNVQPNAKPATRSWSADPSVIDKVVYRFQDASVPPPDHRSFTITVTPSEISKVVDSYGDIVSQQANAITSDQFQEFLSGMSAAGIDLAPATEEARSECTGGTSVSLRILAGDKALLTGSASSCGGGTGGSLAGDVKQVVTLAGALLLPSADAPSIR